MAELRTLARPYAQAVFELACGDDSLAAWSGRLDLVRQVVAHEDMQVLIDSPEVERSTLSELIIEACGEGLDESAGNLVRLLGERRRLRIVPDLVAEFERLRAEKERTIEVQVRSAVELPDQRRQAIANALTKRLDRDVRLHCEIDPELIGGAVIHADDLVIDGSVRSQLQQLAHALAH